MSVCWRWGWSVGGGGRDSGCATWRAECGLRIAQRGMPYEQHARPGSDRSRVTRARDVRHPRPTREANTRQDSRIDSLGDGFAPRVRTARHHPACTAQPGTTRHRRRAYGPAPNRRRAAPGPRLDWPCIAASPFCGTAPDLPCIFRGTPVAPRPLPNHAPATLGRPPAPPPTFAGPTSDPPPAVPRGQQFVLSVTNSQAPCPQQVAPHDHPGCLTLTRRGRSIARTGRNVAPRRRGRPLADPAIGDFQSIPSRRIRPDTSGRGGRFTSHVPPRRRTPRPSLRAQSAVPDRMWPTDEPRLGMAAPRRLARGSPGTLP